MSFGGIVEGAAMGTFETIAVVMAFAFCVVIVVATFAMALSGRDLACFDAYKTTAPKYYRRLKSICRFNCPLVALVCLFIVVASPFAVFAPTGGILAAAFGLAVGGGFLWLNVRWFLWSLRD